MCPKKCIIALRPKKCIIALHPKKCIIALCLKKSIIACARYCIFPKKCIIACAQRNASYDVLDIACARRNASPHCGWNCIVLEVCMCPNQIKSQEYQQMPKTDTLSLLITYIPKASSFKGIIFHGLRTSCHVLRTFFMHIMFLRRHSLKASSSWPTNIISWPKGLIFVYHDPKVS